MSEPWKRRPEIPGYTIEHVLGQGGTSSVYRALQTESGRAVALKILSLEGANLGAAMARLEREAHIGRNLEHPDIVPTLDFGLAAGRSWIAMELLDGFELTHALEDPSFTLTDRLNVVLRVAAALQYAHDHGVVHRDVKPSNIYMTRDGGVRLLDFGIAHVKVDLRLTRPGMIVGTPRYMAPEQAMGEDITVRTDIFSLGVVLYQSLSGQLPWDAESVPRLIIDIATKPPKPLQSVLPAEAYGLSTEQIQRLAAVVHRAIASDPDDRFESMVEFAEQLEPFVGQERSGMSSAAAQSTAWSQRRVDWALARAARLQAEALITSRNPPEDKRSSRREHTLSERGDRVWVFLLATFVIGLGIAVWYATRS